MAVKNLRSGAISHVGRVVGFGRAFHFSVPGMGDNTKYAVILNANGSYGSEALSVYHDGLTDEIAYAEIDAHPEAVAAFNALEAAKAAEERAAEEAREAAVEAREVAAEAARIHKGDAVRVARGRKVPIGTTGKVFWIGEGKFGTRVGVKDAAGNVYWTAYVNVRKVA
jgi:hypothetical protein